MISAEPIAGATRRRRSVLYCTYTEQTDTERLLETLAVDFRAGLHVCRTAPELSSALEREKETACLIVLEAHLAEIVSAARLAASIAPMSELVLLATDEEQSYIQQQLGPAPRLGKHWQFVAPADPALARSLHIIYQPADHRRATRPTLERFNARLTPQNDAVDTRELRQLVISDRFLSSVLESAFDAVILVDRSGNIVAFNPSAERLFGRSQQQVLSTPLWSIADGAWKADVQSAWECHEGALVLSAIELEGATKHVEASATPGYD